jgi:transposase-like protein
MSQKSPTPAAAATKPPAERVVRDIRRRTRKQHSAEDKIRVVLEGLRGEESIAALCRREGIAESLYYSWSKEFLGLCHGNPAGAQRPCDGQANVTPPLPRATAPSPPPGRRAACGGRSGGAGR